MLAASMKRVVESVYEPCGCVNGVRDGVRCFSCDGYGQRYQGEKRLDRGTLDRRDKRFAQRRKPWRGDWLGYDGSFSPPTRVVPGGGVREMDRWVVSWPETGVGFVTGLVYRQEGF